MSDKKPVPPSLAQFALEQLAETSEQAAIDLTVQNVEILRAEIVKRDARIAELEGTLESAVSWDVEQLKVIHSLNAELTALKAQPNVGVALPARMPEVRSWGHDMGGNYEEGLADGYNNAIDDVARLNPCRAQSVADGLRTAAENCAFVMRYIGSMEPDEIDGDNVDLRFEDEEGRDTGADASIVEYAEKVADLLDAMLAAPSALQKESE